MRPDSALRGAVLGALFGTLLALAGCSLPAPSDHLLLKVSASGAYEFDGHPVEAGQLQPALAARHRQGHEMLVEIQASPQAAIAHVQQAVQAARAAHARIAFVEPT